MRHTIITFESNVNDGFVTIRDYEPGTTIILEDVLITGPQHNFSVEMYLDTANIQLKNVRIVGGNVINIWNDWDNSTIENCRFIDCNIVSTRLYGTISGSVFKSFNLLSFGWADERFGVMTVTGCHIESGEVDIDVNSTTILTGNIIKGDHITIYMYEYANLNNNHMFNCEVWPAEGTIVMGNVVINDLAIQPWYHTDTYAPDSIEMHNVVQYIGTT
jgi:hypothetical protein